MSEYTFNNVKRIKSPEDKINEFRTHLLNEIALIKSNQDKNKWVNEFQSGKYRALNELLIDFDYIMKG
jgi:hypothetical protein